MRFGHTESWISIKRESHATGPNTKTPSEWSYYAAVDEIYHSRWAAKQLARFEVVNEAIGHFWPDGHPVKLIQVAGTSGKGSTCQFLQAGLAAYGRAGCYVKPHVFDYAERFVVGGTLVGHGEIARTWEEDVKPYCVQNALRGDAFVLEHDEVSLLIALRIFERRRLDWAIIETGMGGRYDPATSLRVVATVVTNVGQDHEEVLGNEHWQRALEKAGIARPGIPLFTADNDERSSDVLSAICRDVGAPFRRVARKELNELRSAIEAVRPAGSSDSSLASPHQVWNAAAAVAVIRSLVDKADVKELAKRFLKTRYVGRFWKIEEGVFADVAHNPSKTQALAEEIEIRFPRSKKVFVVGITGQRDPVAVIGPLVRQARAVVVTAAGFKGQDPEKVYSRLREAYPNLSAHLAPNPRTTLSVAKALRSPGDAIIFTGSTYMIDQALNRDERLRHLNGSYGWRESKLKQIAGTLNFAIPDKA